MRKQTAGAAVAAVAVAGFALTACGTSSANRSSGGSSSGSAKQSVLTVAESVAPTTLDPQASSLGGDWDAWQLSYQCLLTQSSSGQIEPELATSYTVGPGGTSYTFSLRQGVTFQNGDPFTSADVVYTFDRLQQSAIPYVKSLFNTVQNVAAAGKYQVKFDLSKADANFLFNMASPSVVGCAILDGTTHGNLAQQMNGTGPYAQVSYQPNAELDLKAYPKYWGTAPKTPTLKVLYVPSSLTATADLQSGKVDLIFPSPATVGSLTSNHSVHVDSVVADNVDMLEINTAAKPLDNVLVRRAIALSVDRQQIANLAYGGNAVPTSYLPPGIAWTKKLSDQPYNSLNVSQAKSLLSQAGYPTGFDTTLMYIAGYSPEATQEVTVLQSELAAVGIHAKLTPLTTAAWNTALNTPSYGLSWNYYGYFANPALYLTPRPNRQGPTPSSIQNMISGLSTTSTSGYQSQINALSTEEANQVFPTVPLLAPKSFVAYRDGVSGVHLGANLVRTFLTGVTVG